MHNREIIRFACGITVEKLTVLDFVYGTLKNTFISYEEDDENFLKSLCQEVSDTVSIDPFHNKYMHYIGTKSNGDNFTPNSFYVFDLDGDYTVNLSQVKVAMESSAHGSAECVIKAKENETLNNVLTVLEEMRKYQPITVRELDLYHIDTRDDEDDSDDESTSYNPIRKLKEKLTEQKVNETGKLIVDAVKISRHIRSVKIRDCKLVPIVYRHIASELHECTKLQVLDFRFTERVPSSLGKSIATMKSLRKVDFGWCCMATHVSREVLKGLSHCHHLQELVLAFNTLTNCTTYLFGGPGFPLLYRFWIRQTDLKENDTKSIMAALSEGKLPRVNRFPRFRKLLFGPDSLGDFVSAVSHRALHVLNLVDEHGQPSVSRVVELYLNKTRPGRADVDLILAAARDSKLRELKFLDLSQKQTGIYFLQRKQLSKTHLRDLSTSIHHEKFPQLTGLCLDGNPLTNCLADLLDGKKFIFLRELWVNNTRLSRVDMMCLVKAVNSDRLPELFSLSLKGNKLNKVEPEVESLVRNCVSKYKDRQTPEFGNQHCTLKINLNNNSLSEELKQRINSLINGTHVKVSLSENTENDKYDD